MPHLTPGVNHLLSSGLDWDKRIALAFLLRPARHKWSDSEPLKQETERGLEPVKRCDWASPVSVWEIDQFDGQFEVYNLKKLKHVANLST